MQNISPSGRVVIVGAGMVGSTAAYSLLTQEIAKEILLIDIAQDLAKAQAMDIHDAANFTHGVEVKSANYSDIIDGDIVVITAGAAQKEGQTRLDLLAINVKIIRSIVTEIKNSAKKVYILMVTNPVDVLTYIAAKESGLDSTLVFGSGTLLDSARFRGILHEDFNLNPLNVHAYVLGEHGDSSFPALSCVTIGGVSLKQYVDINENYITKIAERIRHEAYEIIKGKNSTYYGIASAVSEICKAIIRDEKIILPLSTVLNGQYGLNNIAIGIPVKLGSNGVGAIKELELDANEKALLMASAGIIKENLEKIKKPEL